MDKNKALNHAGDKVLIEPLTWCRYIVNTGYAVAALIVLAHVIWYIAARSVLAKPLDIYLREYILLPAIGLFGLNLLVDLLVRSPRVSLSCKEYLSLALFIIFSFYLCFTHDIAKVLLGSFTLSIFSSTIFSNVKITCWTFWMSNLAVLLVGMKRFFTGTLDSSMIMQIFVAWFMFLCSYLLAKVLIRYGHDNQAALTYFDDQQQHMQEQLKLDPFTGLYNRKTFDDYLPKLMKECGRSNKYLSLAMIDLDHFKRVNDLYGHAVGDQALLNQARIMKNIQAENIQVFRIGGEEFAILFRDCDAEEAYRICENMRLLAESEALQEINNENVTFSCGLVCVNPRKASLEEIALAADAALYAAKHNGRNQVVIYNESVPDINRERDRAST